MQLHLPISGRRFRLTTEVFICHRQCPLVLQRKRLLLRLIDAYVNAHADPAKKAQVQRRFEGKFIYTQYSQFKKELSALKGSIPAELLKDYETHLDGIFNLIRLVRNESGHPTGIFLNKQTSPGIRTAENPDDGRIRGTACSRMYRMT